MHTCMHRSSPYHSNYTSTNISLTKHMRSMRQIKFPVASISIYYVVGLASQVLFFLATQVLLIISMRYILLTIDNTGQLLPRKHLCQPLVITYSTWESIFDTGLTRLNLYAHTHIYRMWQIRGPALIWRLSYARAGVAPKPIPNKQPSTIISWPIKPANQLHSIYNKLFFMYLVLKKKKTVLYVQRNLLFFLFKK